MKICSYYRFSSYFREKEKADLRQTNLIGASSEGYFLYFLFIPLLYLIFSFLLGRSLASVHVSTRGTRSILKRGKGTNWCVLPDINNNSLSSIYGDTVTDNRFIYLLVGSESLYMNKLDTGKGFLVPSLGVSFPPERSDAPGGFVFFRR